MTLECECTEVRPDGCVEEASYLHIRNGKYLCGICARNCYDEKDSEELSYEADSYDDGADDLIEWLNSPEEPTVELVVKVIEVRADEEDTDLVLVTLDAVDVDFTYITIQFPQNEVPFVGEKFTLKLERKYD